MRRFTYLITIVLLVLLSNSGSAIAQDNVYLAKPPIVHIDLNGKEPKLGSLPAEIAYAVAGGAFGRDIFHNQPYWAEVPNLGAGSLTACGFKTIPNATLTYPDGRQDKLTGKTYSSRGRIASTIGASVGNGACVYYQVSWTYGMEFGLYSLSLDNTEGHLKHTWGIDYPACRVIVPFDDTNLKYWLMGFTPSETVSIHFYKQNGDDSRGTFTFIASRDVKFNEDGAGVIDLKLGRSSAIHGETK